MRIITGMYRGRTLKTVPDLSVRPATGRVRQTIFDMLVNRIDFDGPRTYPGPSANRTAGECSITRYPPG